MGDGAKPLYITELGLLTGPDPIGMKPYLQEEQASWIVKKIHGFRGFRRSAGLLFLYERLETWKKSDGQWGLYLFDKSPKRSGVAYKAMTQRLADARRAGRAYGLEDDAKRSGEAEVLLFEKNQAAASESEALAVAWVRKKGEPLTISIPADKPVQIETIDGQALEIIQPDAKGFASVRISHVPRYIRSISRKALALGCVRFSPRSYLSGARRKEKPSP